MPVAELKGRKDFSVMSYTEVAGTLLPTKAEDSLDPKTGQPVKYQAIWDADVTQAQTLVLDTENRPLLEVYMRSTVSPTVHLDVSPDGTNWILDVHTWSGFSELNEGFFNASRYVRVRTDPAGAAGDTVTILIIAK